MAQEQAQTCTCKSWLFLHISIYTLFYIHFTSLWRMAFAQNVRACIPLACSQVFLGLGERRGDWEEGRKESLPQSHWMLRSYPNHEPKLGKLSNWLKLVSLTSLWQLSFRSLHLDLIVEVDSTVDSMNEVLCDLSAHLGHEMKLKLCGPDVLVVLPTGFGKSLIFQLFAKILARNSSSTGFARSSIVLCPLESIWGHITMG